jgi:predicted ATPase
VICFEEKQMRFEFLNFGPIKRASLELKPFTLVAGLNQSGKSYILRTLYSILEPVYRFGDSQAFDGRWHFGGRSLKDIEKKLRWVFQVGELGNLVNRFTQTPEAKIKIFSKDKVTITIKKESKKNLIYDCEEIIPDIQIEKVNFIASPVVLDLVKGMATYREFYTTNYGVPDIYWDVVRDLRNIGRADSPQLEKVWKNIQKTIGGHFEYTEKEGFVFVKKRKRFGMTIVATGVKLLGMIQLLIERDCLRKHTMLLLEEPEVHLHPGLRFKLLEILKELIENEVYVIISTHSPEIVAYIEYLINTDKLDINKCSFLFLETDESGLVSSGESTNDVKVLHKIMMSLTEDLFELSVKEFEELQW